MFTHPDLHLDFARLRDADIAREAEKFRLLNGVRRRQHGLPGPVRHGRR